MPKFQPLVGHEWAKSGWKALLPEADFAELTELRLSAMRAQETFDGNPTDEHRVAFAERKSIFSAAYVAAQKLVENQLACENALNFSDRSKIWNILRKLRGSASPVPLHSGVLLDHFKGIYFDPTAPLDVSVPSDCRTEGPVDAESSKLEDVFSMAELEKAIRDSNAGSAPGPDKISISILQELFLDKPGPLEVLLEFFNVCFLEARLPSSWGESEIFCLFKGKGSVQSADNYRGITLLNACFKVYERILYNRLRPWAEGNGAFGSNQFGFRSHRSAEDAIFAVRTFCDTCILERKRGYLAFVDIQKAFPSVPRDKLLRKLHEIGIPPRFLSAIASIFHNNSGCLRLDGFVTERFPINRGVREGSVLSPILFALYYADVLDVVGGDGARAPDGTQMDSTVLFNHVPVANQCILYADDLVILSTSEEDMSVRLDILSEKLFLLGLSANVAKSEMLIICPRRGPLNPYSSRYPLPTLYLAGLPIPPVRKVKYLGFWLDEYGSDAIHVRYCETKARVACSELSRLLRKLNVSSIKTIMLLFRSLVLSQFYAMSICSMKIVSALGKTFALFMKEVYGLLGATALPFFSLLGLMDSPLVLLFKRRVSFIRRVTVRRDASIVHEALEAARFHLMPRGHGWFVEMNSLLKVWEESIPWTIDFVLYESELCHSLQEASVLAYQEVGSRLITLEFFLFLFEGGLIPPGFWSAFSEYSPMLQRPILLLLAGNIRYSSFFLRRIRFCRYCSVSLHSKHFFECPHFDVGCSPADLCLLVTSQDWACFFETCLRALRDWKYEIDRFSVEQADLEMLLASL